MKEEKTGARGAEAMGERLRNAFDCRPLACVSACFVLGVIVGDCVSVPWLLCAAAFSLLAGGALCLRRRPFVLGAAFALGLVLITRALYVPELPLGSGLALSGRIVSEPEATENGLRVTLEQVTVEGERLPCLLSLSVYGEEVRLGDYAPGSRVSGTVKTYRTTETHNPHAFSYRSYLWRKGIGLCASGRSDRLTVRPGVSLRSGLLSLRSRLARQITRLYPEPYAGIVRALVLADKTELDEDIQEIFRICGIAHLLALSGLHLAVLAGAVHWLLSRLRLSHRICFSVTMAILCAYAVLVGSPASVMRAMLLYGFLTLAHVTSRPYDGLTALLAALAILLLMNPLSIEDSGLILSFTSVGGILFFQGLIRTPVEHRSAARHPRLERMRHRALSYLMEATAVSISAQLGSLPAIICSFHEINLLSLAANLFAVPLVSLALPLALFSVPVSLVSLPLGRAMALPVRWVLWLVNGLSGQFATFSFAVVRCASWPVRLLVAYALCALLASPYCLRRQSLRYLFLALLPVLCLVAWLPPRFQHTTGLEVQFVDVGQGDGAVLFCEGEVCLMDVGEYDNMADYLDAIGKAPDRVILSHPHSDHCAGLEALIERFSGVEMYISDSFLACEDKDEGVEKLLYQAQAAGWRLHEVREGETLSLSDNVTARVIQAAGEPLDQGNELSMVVQVSYAGRSVLFTGDLGLRYEAEEYPDCDVLKVAHHGSKYSTGERLLSSARPEIAVISVGYNRYGHPTQEALSRLQEAGAQVYRTDQCGLITLCVSPDGELSISTYLEG